MVAVVLLLLLWWCWCCCCCCGGGVVAVIVVVVVVVVWWWWWCCRCGSGGGGGCCCCCGGGVVVVVVVVVVVAVHALSLSLCACVRAEHTLSLCACVLCTRSLSLSLRVHHSFLRVSGAPRQRLRAAGHGAERARVLRGPHDGRLALRRVPQSPPLRRRRTARRESTNIFCFVLH